jgi:hypothetical protein
MRNNEAISDALPTRYTIIQNNTPSYEKEKEIRRACAGPSSPISWSLLGPTSRIPCQLDHCSLEAFSDAGVVGLGEEPTIFPDDNDEA